MLQRLLLLPLLSPLLAALLIAAINPRPWVALRLLTWTSPAWPLGAWLAGATAAGAGLSAAGTGLALLGRPNPTPARRQVRRSGEAADASEPAPWRRRPAATPAPGAAASGSAWAGPSRQAGDPPPTVSVPFRVIRRGSGAAGPTATAAAPTASATTTGTGSTGTASSSGAEDWNQSDSDDW